MVDIDKAVIARLRKGKETFEVLVDCGKALDFREGKVSIEDALATSKIYKDVKQDMAASEHEMLKLFGTTDAKEVAKIILTKGEIQLTTEYRKRMCDERKRQLIEIIRKNAVDPRTGLPHPLDRIERAFEQKRVNIDEFKTAEKQLHDVVRKISDILPLKFETRELSVKIPAPFATKSAGVIKSMARLVQNDWQSDGSLLAIVEIPAGMQAEFEDAMQKIAHGNAEIKLISKK